jgi:Ran GTPase-activating protein (RanGAP) involved in mRNA processing and transport
VEKLCAASYFRNLLKLYLDDNGLTALAGRHLGKSEFLTKLTHLSLGYNNLGDEGIQNLVQSTNGQSLTQLSLQQNSLTF